MGTKLGKIESKSESKQTAEITREEYLLIKSIWEKIETEPKTHGSGFYMRLFAKYPQYIRYFLNDPIRDDVNPDALMVIKFTAIFEVLGYLILDFYNKPKQFNQLLGFVGMTHKDMCIESEDIHNFLTTLIDYLKDVTSDLMTDTCELVFVAFFDNLKQLMVKSMEDERRRFSDENEEGTVVRSHLVVLLPCLRLDHSNKLIYGQPREYWKIKEQEWKSKIRFWEQEEQLASVTAVNFQNTTDSTSSEDEGSQKTKIRVDLGSEIRKEENRDDAFPSQMTRYFINERLASILHFDRRPSELSDGAEANEIEESVLINNSKARSVANVKLTPRERHRAQAAAKRSAPSRPSGHLFSSTDTSSPGQSDGSSARERRRSTWN